MLKHETSGPTADGKWLVVYATPGCTVPTPVCECSTCGQAKTEAQRLNKLQRRQEQAAQREHARRYLRDQRMGWGQN